jgi:hypothetical protein
MVYSIFVASPSDLKHAHERLNQMVTSGHYSGPVKRAGRLKSPAKKVAPKMDTGEPHVYQG